VSKFRNVVALDSEYEVEGGEFNLVRGDLPKVLCMVAHVLDGDLQHVRTVKLWRGEFGPAPPFPIDDDTLVIGYSLWAEMTIFLTLGWKFAKHLFDLHTAYLAASNVLLPHDPDVVRSRPRKDFATACHAYGLEGWEKIDKGEIASDIGEGRWWIHGREAVFAYCEEDVKMSVQLLQAQLEGRGRRLPPSDFRLNLHWANYSAKATALIQAKGMPIDMPLWHAVQDNKPAVIRALLRRFDPGHYTDLPIYDPDGHWSYERFENWLVHTGVTEWPRLETGQLDISGDAFRLMSHIPGIASLHVLKDSLNVIVKANLPIGRDGRNRPSLFPFGTTTGRNAHGKSLFNSHAAMRGFVVFSEETPGYYFDWSQQEVIIGASLSGDLALIDAYRSGDVYHAFARDIGLTADPDPVHWKKNDPEKIRDRMKTLYLAIMYGMGIPSIATSLQRHPLIASELTNSTSGAIRGSGHGGQSAPWPRCSTAR
jgi:DNA polymerase I